MLRLAFTLVKLKNKTVVLQLNPTATDTRRVYSSRRNGFVFWPAAWLVKLKNKTVVLQLNPTATDTRRVYSSWTNGDTLRYDQLFD